MANDCKVCVGLTRFFEIRLTELTYEKQVYAIALLLNTVDAEIIVSISGNTNCGTTARLLRSRARLAQLLSLKRDDSGQQEIQRG